MKIVRWVVISVLLTAPFSNTSAQQNPNSIQVLRDACRAAPAGYCLGFIEGFGQLMLVNGVEHHPDFAMCPPGGQLPTGGAMIQSFLNWADGHPEAWPQPALAGVAVALGQTWPCQKSN